MVVIELPLTDSTIPTWSGFPSPCQSKMIISPGWAFAAFAANPILLASDQMLGT